MNLRAVGLLSSLFVLTDPFFVTDVGVAGGFELAFDAGQLSSP